MNESTVKRNKADRSFVQHDRPAEREERFGLWVLVGSENLANDNRGTIVIADDLFDE
jgi:hypothetical protein